MWLHWNINNKHAFREKKVQRSWDLQIWIKTPALTTSEQVNWTRMRLSFLIYKSDPRSGLEFSVRMKKSCFGLFNVVATSHPWLLRPRNVATVTEELDSKFYLITWYFANAGGIWDLGLIAGSGRFLEEGMETHLQYPWRIPKTGEPGGLQSIGFQRVRHWSSLVQMHQIFK